MRCVSNKWIVRRYRRDELYSKFSFTKVGLQVKEFHDFIFSIFSYMYLTTIAIKSYLQDIFTILIRKLTEIYISLKNS